MPFVTAAVNAFFWIASFAGTNASANKSVDYIDGPATEELRRDRQESQKVGALVARDEK